ncbi:4-phosphoerythronate dehydrogenase [candidate division WOR-3 bacterium]|mgnify:CR=1 FL=1|uniref:4-phosphoerythronate dehydrogenase n=1 Tax=candidate division WOR-3 bacterium TaxID=2052148 RepID=A0A660SEQ5_UNCW3|nr:MAG: 4-phosphoerythronate dehydrogenase [candidate division WOR-3 bacterium]
MRIAADDSIPWVEEAFRTIGEVILLPPEEMVRENIGNCDVLVVRTTTKVNEDLLLGTKVKFVATSAVGVDHIDLDFLKKHNIGFANAKGCNSRAVAEYVFAALFALAAELDLDLRRSKIGVVGVGNIGSIVVRTADQIGMMVRKNDPPLKRQTGDPSFLTLDDLMDCDIITLHVPLTYEGEDATYHLFNRERIFQLKDGAILINTSRGPVVDSKALIEAIDLKHLITVIDVWENEPDVDIELIKRSAIATPHIAGHSQEGVVTAVKMIYEQTCRYFNIKPLWQSDHLLRPPDPCEYQIELETEKRCQLIDGIIRKVYDIRKDSNDLSLISLHRPEERKGYFLHLRNNHRLRREFPNYTVKLRDCDPEAVRILSALGFQTIEV